MYHQIYDIILGFASVFIISKKEQHVPVVCVYVGKKVLVPREEMIEEAMTDLWLSLHLSYLSFCSENSMIYF